MEILIAVIGNVSEGTDEKLKGREPSDRQREKRER
jgi:hypothetical protein